MHFCGLNYYYLDSRASWHRHNAKEFQSQVSLYRLLLFRQKFRKVFQSYMHILVLKINTLSTLGIRFRG